MTPQQLVWLYVVLASLQVLIGLPALGNFWRVRKLVLLRLFAFRALMTGLSHLTSAAALLYFAFVLNQRGVAILLLVWIAGDLGKVIGEVALFSDLWLIFNGRGSFWHRASSPQAAPGPIVPPEPPTDKEG